MKTLKLVILSGLLCGSSLGLPSLVHAQQPANPTQTQIQRSDESPIYTLRVNVVDRTTKAINYRHRSGATKVDFKGTPLLPDAHGQAKVESKQGYIEIEVEFDELQSATRYGPEFLTYVMWAITPEGRATNLGEVILNGSESKLNVTTELQAFGLVVTAEPYFAVSQPSDVVVLDNFFRSDTAGKVEEVEAKYHLLKRGLYTVNVTPKDLKPIPLDKKTPLDLYEARNAVRIAQWAGADKDAADSFKKADRLLRDAEATQSKKPRSREVSTLAREAVQAAEDARLIALKTQEEKQLAMERKAAADREALARQQADLAKARADEDARRRLQAEADQRVEAERRGRAEAERAAAEAKSQVALAEAAAAKDRELKAQADAELARRNAAQTEKDKAQLRSSLAQQLNLILETRESARGLIVNISDVLFDFDQATLKPGAREKLAKVSGILLAHRGLSLMVEGHTDSVGTEDYNQRLSERRAEAVRDYLAQQGIPGSALSAKGLGKSLPVASNDTAEGRQRNRRVELVVAGDVIGVPLTSNLTRP